MEILEAYDLTGSYRAAAELAGVDHHTVKRYVELRGQGGDPTKRQQRPKMIDEFMSKIEELIERSGGRIGADRVHEKITAMGFTGTGRTTRRAVAAAKASYQAGHRRVFRPWIPEPGLWIQWDVRHEVLCFEGGARPSRSSCRSRGLEAEGSLNREVPGRAESSPANDGTGRYYQTARARQARRIGTTRVNQWLTSRKEAHRLQPGGYGPGCSTRRLVSYVSTTSASDVLADAEGHGEGLRRNRGEAAGRKLGAAPADRSTVNMGTASRLPNHPRHQRGWGQTHRRLTAVERGGAFVVVRGRESRPHGEGRQRVRSKRTGRAGGRW
ncbi:hypothetical protein GCM10022403_083790 [Streptomyces coacervatus]|uniref:Transposase n=1 Tax=Streptomyces coacervatus TaxID=647381 RepID=A0ABP7J9Q3_9ACTN